MPNYDATNIPIKQSIHQINNYKCKITICAKYLWEKKNGLNGKYNGKKGARWDDEVRKVQISNICSNSHLLAL